jgi:predicted acyl esterase
MGSWTHGHMGIPYSGDVDFGPEALFDWNAFRLRWFDHWLKGMNTGLDKEPPVKIFLMGGGNGRKTPEGHLKHGGTWRFEKDWPLPRTKYTPFYLHGNMSLDTTPPTESKLSSSYQYDPKKPVPTIGGHLSSLDYLGPAPTPLGMFDIMSRKVPVVEAGGFDQREREGWFGCKPPYLPLATRHDILVFSTPPLKEDLEITGPITVNLWVGSSAPDTDFTAKLLDVYPPNQDYPKGYALNLTDGILRSRYRNSRETPEFMTPREIYEIRFPIYPTSNLFKAGHQIRLDISSSNWPRFDRNPNTSEPLGVHTRTIIAENTVYHDAEHPSHVVLPVIPFYE